MLSQAKSHILLAAIYLPTNTTPERIKALAPYFSPTFIEPLKVDSAKARRKKNVHTRDIKGYITITPPKKECLWISKFPQKPDHKVCKKTRMSFTPENLDNLGRLRWFIKVRGVPEPTMVTWQSPYRLASYILPGERMVHETYISECQAFYTPKKIPMAKVTLIDGRKWIITFPKKHLNSYYTGDYSLKFDGLFIRNSKKKSTLKKIVESSTGKVKSGDKPGPQTDERYWKRVDKNSKQSKKLTKKAVDPVQLYWIVAAEGSYKMSARNFQSDGSQGPKDGTCRYRFSHTGDDIHSGAVECHDTSEFDVVYVVLPCLNEFATHRK